MIMAMEKKKELLNLLQIGVNIVRMENSRKSINNQKLLVKEHLVKYLNVKKYLI